MPWAVAHTYTSHEDQAVKNLDRQGYEAYLPKYTRPRPTRVTEQQSLPLFPGYLFVLLLPRQPWYPINSTTGIIRLLTTRIGKHRDPAPLLVDDDFIDGLRGNYVAEHLPPNAEVRVRQRNSAFFDKVGTVVSMSKSERVSVLMHLFNRNMVVEFSDPSDLELVA